MSSRKSSLDIVIRATKADAERLERAAKSAASAAGEYLAFLSRFPPATIESLRKRDGPRGEPFRLENK